jgi:hypothetical protein
VLQYSAWRLRLCHNGGGRRRGNIGHPVSVTRAFGGCKYGNVRVVGPLRWGDYSCDR